MILKEKNIYYGFRHFDDIISHAVCLYWGFTLSFRAIEKVQAYWGLDISYESIRQWNVADFLIIRRIEPRVCVSRPRFNPETVNIKLVTVILCFTLSVC